MKETSLILMMFFALVCGGGCFWVKSDVDASYADFEVIEMGGLISVHGEGNEHLASIFLQFPDGTIKNGAEITTNDVEPLFHSKPEVNTDGTVCYGSINYDFEFTFRDNVLERVVIGRDQKFGFGKSRDGPFVKLPLNGSQDSRLIEIFGRPKKTKSKPKPFV